MNYLQILLLILVLIFSGCTQNSQSTLKADNQTDNTKSNDKEEILKLIKQVIIWGDSKESIGLLPVLTDSKDSVYIGFDMIELKSNLDKLKETNYFATEFIENYRQIIVTLDKKLRNGEYEKWFVGDLPTFIFANDYSPWWNGQESFPIEKGMVELINLDKDKGEFDFACGDKGHGCDGLENYKMRFRVVKEDNKWKISYLEGFNFKESTRKDGVPEKTTTR
ncbi:MAG: hypothetical protein Q8928_12405 [Bacteroidota bacterium]|nr:hypothetical protein [Bacteroidota bacterium]